MYSRVIGYFLTWQFDLSNKSDGDLSEILHLFRVITNKSKVKSKEWDCQSYMDDSDSRQHWRRGPVLAPWPGTRPDCNWYVSVVITLPALLQPWCTQFGCTVAVPIVTLLACSCKLLHCGVPECSNWAQLLYLKCMHVVVETSIYVAFYSHLGIST